LAVKKKSIKLNSKKKIVKVESKVIIPTPVKVVPKRRSAPKKKRSAPKRKTVVKKVVPKLKRASPEVSFYFSDGKVCRDLEELAHVIDDLEDEAFELHVNDSKNDFANWVHDVHDEKELSDKLKKTKCKNRHVIEVLKVVVTKK